jgi:hypothetical protein
MEPVKTRCIATWWEDKPEADSTTFVPETEEVEVEIHWEGDAFFIDGLRDGLYLSIPLHGIVKPMADGSTPAKGLAR